MKHFKKWVGVLVLCTAGHAISAQTIVNGVPYQPPTEEARIRAYVHETYGVPGIAKTTIRATIGQIRGTPVGWGQDFPGFAQRFGSEAGVTAIDGTVKLGLSTLFHEDTRYIRCRTCSVGGKIANAFLAEVTARHGSEGERMISLTPIVSHISGPIVAATVWYPPGNGGASVGFRDARSVIVVSFAVHLVEEFVLPLFGK